MVRGTLAPPVDRPSTPGGNTRHQPQAAHQRRAQGRRDRGQDLVLHRGDPGQRLDHHRETRGAQVDRLRPPVRGEAAPLEPAARDHAPDHLGHGVLVDAGALGELGLGGARVLVDRDEERELLARRPVGSDRGGEQLVRALMWASDS
jgi:hypothetical protein